MAVRVERRRVERADNPLALLRSPLARLGHLPPPAKVTPIVILAAHGWGPLEEDAALRMQRLGRLVIAQNKLGAWELARHWADFTGTEIALVIDPSFSAANIGAVEQARPGPGDWLLFTQADVRIGPGALEQAVALSTSLQGADPFPPAIGASGGFLHDWPGPGPLTITEYGRNIGGYRYTYDAVDYITGYFVLVRADAYAASGGWNPAYSLYFEDCDLGLRLASVGCRSIIDPLLEVDHARSTTILREHGHLPRRFLQEHSRARFLAAWARLCIER